MHNVRFVHFGYAYCVDSAISGNIQLIYSRYIYCQITLLEFINYMSRWVFIIPELLSVAATDLSALELPALQLLLSRASFQQDELCVCYEQTLFKHFAYKVPEPNKIPIARSCWAEDFSSTPSNDTVCVEPVHLLLDKSNAQLLDSGCLQLLEHETTELISSLNDHFSPDGLKFVQATNERWYLQGLDPELLSALPVKQLAGRKIASFLTDGIEAKEWRQLMTEAQMLLYSHSVNTHRQSRAQLPINALWFWGNGALPEQITQPEPNTASKQSMRVYSDEVFCKGLSHASGHEVRSKEELSFEGDSSIDRVFVDTDGRDHIIYGQSEQWGDWITQLEQHVFQPSLLALKSGNISELTLSIGDGREFSLTARDIRKFWRRKKPLASFSLDQLNDPSQ